ncbi:MAG: hypothetical protein KGJ86_11310 [Chloroflexota bacterium]|nr:hypothetical protein [Chloroflexota bacterium]
MTAGGGLFDSPDGVRVGRRRGRPGITRWALTLAVLAWAWARRVHAPISIPPHGVSVDGCAGEVLERVWQQFENGPNVVVHGDGRVLARFTGKAGPFSYQTAEVVSRLPDGMSFEHVGGTFYACRETFTVRDVGAGRTRIDHAGTFTMRGGLAGWLLGMLVVRRLFQDHVTEAMRRSSGAVELGGRR